MRRSIHTSLGLAIAITAAGCSLFQTQGLQQASENSGAAKIKSLAFSGNGFWYQFGQAPNPDLPWPPFNLKTYSADINYDTASARVQISRSQVIEAGRQRPAPVEQKVDQYVSGNSAWNIATSGTPTVTPQTTAVEERTAEIWSTPQGFLKAATANHAESKTVGDKTEVSFKVAGKYRYIGTINKLNQLERVQTWIDNPVLGDTLVDTQFSNYKDFGGIQFPAHIARQQGGFPVLDIDVTSVKANPEVTIAVPSEATKPTPITVTTSKLAEGVYYITGGTHHSVAIDQRDHIVVVEAPLNEDRSQAVINKLKEIIPNKPIKYLINTHAHFDHAGGLRTYVDEGSIIVTPQTNQTYYQKVWATPHSINPDRLEKSKKTAQFISFTGNKQVISDGKRPIEIYPLTGNSHNDAFVLVYLPNEKILVEADAFNPTAANVPPPASPNPYSVNLYEVIQKLKLNVDQIAGLHGPRVVTLADLRTAIGLK